MVNIPPPPIKKSLKSKVCKMEYGDDFLDPTGGVVAEFGI